MTSEPRAPGISAEYVAGIRRRMLAGGAYMAFRQIAGLVLGTAGAFLLSGIIGAADYGRYATALAVVGFVQALGHTGLITHLLRADADPAPRVYGVAATVLLATSGVAAAGLVLALPAVAAHWWTDSNLHAAAVLMVPALPLIFYTQIVAARLERRLDYRPLVRADLIGQLTFHSVGLPLAVLGAGMKAPVIAWWVQQTLVLALTVCATRAVVRPAWNRSVAAQLIRAGSSISLSLWVWQLRVLINPVCVGRVAGPEAVGHIALAIRLVDGLAIARSAAWRVATAGLARMQRAHHELLQTIEIGAVLQLLIFGPPLVLGAWIFVFAGTLLGDEWRPTALVFPFIAAGCVLNGVFALHSSALYAAGAAGKVTQFNLAYVVLLAVGAVAFVPAHGVVGYGMAEVLAAAAYPIVHVGVARTIGRPAYGMVWPVAAMILAALAAQRLGWWSLIVACAVLAWPVSRRGLGKAVRDSLALLRSPAAAAPAA